MTIALSLFFARGVGGWHWASGLELATFLPLRLPRALVALAAGAILAVSGTLVQRMTGNPMASPEVLGISSGAAIGVILLFLVGIELDRTNMILAATVGALVTLGAILLMAEKHPSRPTISCFREFPCRPWGRGLLRSCWQAAIRASISCSAGFPARPTARPWAMR
uniref:iron chelate uptake ABC transporter family permease subunit n=1 Tax=Neorhizobium sp. EC2-8 TaxID=3129230 RepID=UPI0031014483